MSDEQDAGQPPPSEHSDNEILSFLPQTHQIIAP